jgi:hypothetical protein
VTTAETPPATEALPAAEPGLEDLDPATPHEEAGPLERKSDPLAGPPPPVGQGWPPRSEPTERSYAVAGRNGGPSSPGPVRSPSSAPRRIYGTRRRLRVRLAVITGLLGFLIAAVVLTVPELVAGGPVDGGSGRTTLLSGGSGEESQRGDGAEDRVTEGDEGESPDGGDAGDTEPAPDDGGGSSEPDEPSSERRQRNQRSTERRVQSDQSRGGESGASQRSSSQRAPTQHAAPSRPSDGGGDAP